VGGQRMGTHIGIDVGIALDAFAGADLGATVWVKRRLAGDVAGAQGRRRRDGWRPGFPGAAAQAGT
jgi:hypothetical protein